MLPSGSTRPDQPIANVSNCPASSWFSDVTNSVGSSTTLKPIGFSIDWITWPSRAATGSVPSIRCTVTPGDAPERVNAAFAPADVGSQLARDPLRRRVPRRAGRNREAVGIHRAAEDDLVDHLPVERELERLPQVGRLRDRRAGVRVRQLAEPLRVADVHRDALVADRGRLEQPQRLVVGNRLEVGRGEALGHVDVVRAKVRSPCRRIGDDLPHDRVEVDLRLAVVERRLGQRDVVAGATRSLYMNGPTQTGLVANLSPSAFSAFGDMIIPARSASCAVIGE